MKIKALVSAIGLIAAIALCSRPALAVMGTSTVPINITTGTTTTLVAAIPGQSIYVTAYNFSIAGSSPTITFGYGTGALGACTSMVALTGPMGELGGTSAIYSMSPGSTELFKTPVSTALCALSGTGANIYGWLRFAQLVGR